MAKSKTPPPPPSPEACEHLLTVIRSSAEPLPAIALARLLVGPFQIAARQLAPLLDDYVASGKLHVLLPTTGRGKPRYWDRDARAMSRAAALEAVERADGPLTAGDVSRRLSIPLKVTESELTAILDAHVAAGKLHHFPPKTPKSKRRYWHRDPLEFGRQAILRVIDAKGPQTESQLKKAAGGLSADQFQQVFENALAARVFWRHPPHGKTKKEVFGRTAPSPGPYLRDVGRQLATIVGQLIAASVPQNDLRRALVQLVEAAGVPFSAAATSRPEVRPAAPLAAVDLVGLMKRIEPGADRGALVGSRDLRRAAQLDKADFDRAVLDLSRQGRVSLHRHDYATSLTPTERDDLVTDGAGTYYVGMALRHTH